MDELDLLKQDWKRQEKSLPQVDSNEIRVMMHKRSTSIVKWIFIISIVEFVFWIGIESLSYFDNSLEMIKDLGLGTFYRASLILNYVMIAVFISLFFMNFRKIKTNDSVKSLMKNIIKTRKAVKAYVWFNVLFFSITFLIVCFAAYSQELVDQSLKVKLITLGLFFVVFVVILLLLIGFYKLLYGILTKRLHKNYEALRKIEMKE